MLSTSRYRYIKIAGRTLTTLVYVGLVSCSGYHQNSTVDPTGEKTEPRVVAAPQLAPKLAAIQSRTTEPAPASTFAVQAKTFSLPQLELSESPLADQKALSLWATYYYIHSTRETARGTPLLNINNAALSPKISAHDWCMGGIQGTVRITDATGVTRTYNYADQKGPQQLRCEKVLGWPAARTKRAPWIKATGRVRYVIASGPYGDGVQNYQLQPFRTIAVDQRTIPYGSVIYIPAARGLPFPAPDGSLINHDGYFFAGDTGGAIKGNHIDVFQASSNVDVFPTWIKSTATGTFDAYRVRNPAIIEALTKQHTVAAIP